jgi:hypothetical protein
MAPQTKEALIGRNDIETAAIGFCHLSEPNHPFRKIRPLGRFDSVIGPFMIRRFDAVPRKH